jgi:hypothetical protein
VPTDSGLFPLLDPIPWSFLTRYSNQLLYTKNKTKLVPAQVPVMMAVIIAVTDQSPF